jgi:hypothetical protein
MAQVLCGRCCSQKINCAHCVGQNKCDIVLAVLTNHKAGNKADDRARIQLASKSIAHRASRQTNRDKTKQQLVPTLSMNPQRSV